MSDRNRDEPLILPAGEKDLDRAIDRLEGLLGEHDREAPAFMPADGVADDDMELPILTDVVDPLSSPHKTVSDPKPSQQSVSQAATVAAGRDPDAVLSALEPLIDAEIERHTRDLKTRLMDLLRQRLEREQSDLPDTTSKTPPANRDDDTLPLFGDLQGPDKD